MVKPWRKFPNAMPPGAWGLIVWLLLGLPLSAELQFENSSLTHKAGFDETAYEGVFKFVVKGDQPVVIKNLRSSCGCTVPSLAKKQYLPGEQDAVHAIFEFGSRTGPQHKTIFVETSQGSMELSMTVQIPVKWRLSTRSLFWEQGEKRSAKEVLLNVYYDLPVSFQAIDHLADAFSLVSSEIRDDGATVAFMIAPKKNGPTGIHRAEVTLKTAGGELIIVPIYLRAL